MTDVDLTTNVTLNTETVDVTVYEDVGNTGSTDNSETITGVADGSTTYTLTTLDGRLGNAYWAEISLSSASITTTPIVHSITLGVYGLDGKETLDLTPSGVVSATTSLLGNASIAPSLTGTATGVVSVTGQDSLNPQMGRSIYVSARTDLPDAQNLTLDASVDSELTANWDDVLNNGEYRVEWKEEEPNTETSYSDANSAVVGEATTAYTIANLLDGEKYSVRLRTQTTHGVGPWLEAADITNLTPADPPTATNTSQTSVDLDWVRNSDFEGSQPIYRKRTDFDYPSGSAGRHVATVGDSVSSGTDDTAAPDREYTYIIRALTQWVHADSDPSDPVTTTSIGLDDRAVPPQSWYAEIEHPSATTVTPQILDDPVRRPTVNGYPRVELSVPQDDTWHATAFDDAPLSVWHDGDRVPIDRLEHRRLRPDRTVLEGRGGTQLDQRVITEVDTQKTHLFAQDLIQNNTSYTANIDTPQSETTERVIQQADTDTELQQALDDIPTDLPLQITGGGLLEPLQTAHNIDVAGSMTLGGDVSDSTATGGTTEAHTTISDSVSISIPYTLPASEIGVGVRFRNPNDPDGDGNYEGNGFAVEVGGQAILNAADGFEVPDGAYRWQTRTGATNDVSGSVTVKFDASSSGNNYTTHIDRIVVYDARYNYTFDNTLHTSGGHLDGPELYPDTVRQTMTPIETPLAISDLTLDVQTPDSVGTAELALGEDGTTTWNTATNVLSHSISYTQLDTTARGRLGVGRDRNVSRDTATPRTGYQPHAIDSLTMTAILDDTPVITNRSFDDRLINILQEVAEIGNFVFEVQADGDTTTFEMTQLEQRSTTTDPSLATYDVERQTEDVIERAIVYGGAQRLTRQTVTANHGTWVDLPFSDAKIVESRETIYDGSTEYPRGTDYEIRYTAADGIPEIKTLSGGSITDGATLSVDADVKPRGKYVAGGVTNESEARSTIEDIPGLASKQMCDQVALYLVEETGNALIEAEVTVPHDSVGWSVIEAIDPEQLPTDGPMQVREIESNPTETTLRLASRQSANEVVQDIRDRTARNSERI